jgi:hypothetical protein
MRLNQLEPAAFDFRTPCSSVDMVKRMINDLIQNYAIQNKADKVRELQTLLSVLLEQ